MNMSRDAPAGRLYLWGVSTYGASPPVGRFHLWGVSTCGASPHAGRLYMWGVSTCGASLQYITCDNINPMTLFKNKYRVGSTRLAEWDYGQAGYYFVTICTKDRVHFFGKIVAGDMQLSSIGEIVVQEWGKTQIIRSNVILDEWIIMPNHMHMIVVITHKIDSIPDVETPRRGVSTGRGVSTPKQSQTIAASEKWAANTLGSMIGQFKGKCTKRIRAQGYNDFSWQSRFYDHIIRSEDALHKSRLYIASNPMNWDQDRDNVAGVDM